MYLVPNTGQPDLAATQEIHRRRQRVQLARLLQITEKMLEYAQAGDWPAVEELEAMRKQELDACYEMQQQAPSLVVAEALATLLYLNDQIVALVKLARGKLVVEHNTLARNRVLIELYEDDLP
ncbi:MAG TPA: flagellar protein FliT [Candidatus Acidoferrum sp.]|nr:flagellar protein FliT [Candidatus Acidoferrum sp.]